MSGASISWPTAGATAGAGKTALSIFLGLAFTFGLFLGIAQLQNTAPAVRPPEIDDLRAVAVPLESPPPPHEVPPEAEPAVTTVTGFEATPSDSPVKIAVTPPELADFLPPPPAAPAAVIQVGQLYTNLKPRVDFAGDSQRIFQTSEVDQVPRVLHTVMPAVSRRLLKNDTAHVTVILVIDPNGIVTNARLTQSSGNPELDAILLENVQEWAFSPAAKKGKRVRCLIQQGFNIKLPSASRFTL